MLREEISVADGLGGLGRACGGEAAVVHCGRKSFKERRGVCHWEVEIGHGILRLRKVRYLNPVEDEIIPLIPSTMFQLQ